MLARLLPALLLFFVGPACAHYGLAEQDVPELALETVAVDGDSGLDPAALTRTMTARLQRQGIPTNWGGSGQPAVCAITIIESGAAGGAWSPTARAVCRIGTVDFEATGHASASIDTPTGGSIRAVQQAAATQAAVAVSDQIAANYGNREILDGEEK